MSFEIYDEADLSNIDAHVKMAASRAESLPRVLTVDEILKLDFAEAVMLIEGIIPASGASLIVGAAKSGKTSTLSRWRLQWQKDPHCMDITPC